MPTLTALEAPQTPARRCALIQKRFEHTAPADQQRDKLDEGLRQADRLIKTLRQRQSRVVEAA
ncbi:hypothetical protein [Kocuria himachalensis]